MHRLAGFVIELSAIYNKQPVKCQFPKCTFSRQVGNEYYLSADFFNRLFKSIFLNAQTAKKEILFLSFDIPGERRILKDRK